METTNWYRNTTTCANGIVYSTQFRVARTEKSGRSGTLPAIKDVRRSAKLAHEAAVELGLIMNNNWLVGVDEHLIFTFDDCGLQDIIRRAGSDNRDAILEAGTEWFRVGFLKMLRRKCAKACVDLKYVWVVSDTKGDTGEPKRLHIHMVCSTAVRKVAERCWRAGIVKHKALYSSKHGDLQELADYMIAQVRTVSGKKRYHPSRNLAKPVRSDPVPVLRPGEELEPPKGCELIYRSDSTPGHPKMIRYWRPPRSDFDEEEWRLV